MGERKSVGEMDEKTRDVIVVGGGISGLTIAWHLKRAGTDVVLVEAGEAVGGCMQTEQRDGFLLEKGPFNVMVRDPSFEQLLDGIADRVRVVTADKAAHARFLYRRGRLIAVPTGPVAFATSRLLSLGGRLRVVRGFLASRRANGQEPTIEEFASRRLGTEFAETMVSAAVAGILAGDISKLSMYACFPFVVRFDTTARSPLLYALSVMLKRMRDKTRHKRRWKGLVSIDRGLGGMADALAAALGPDVRTGCRVERVEHGESGYVLTGRMADGGTRVLRSARLVLGTPLREAGRLLAPLVPEAPQIAGRIDSAALTVLNLAFRQEDVGHPLRGFGFLVPRNEPEFPLMGVLWADSAFPHHGKLGHRLVRVFIGGTRTPDVLSRSDDELLRVARGALRELLHIDGEPVLVDICPYPDAIPQYYPGHNEKIARLRAAARGVPGLRLVGNYLEGVSINDCIKLSTATAKEMIEEGKVHVRHW